MSTKHCKELEYRLSTTATEPCVAILTYTVREQTIFKMCMITLKRDIAHPDGVYRMTGD